MTIDERLRLNIHTKFSELLGREEADALIAHIMPVPWTEVATKDDVRVLSAELGGEIAQLRGELHREIGAVRAEIGAVRAEIGVVQAEIGVVRGEIGGLRAELHETIVGQTRWLMGYVTALSVAMLAVARLAL